MLATGRGPSVHALGVSGISVGSLIAPGADTTATPLAFPLVEVVTLDCAGTLAYAQIQRLRPHTAGQR